MASEGYDALVRGFRWDLPADCSIALEACDRWADGTARPAIRHLHDDGRVATLSFDGLRDQSSRLANLLAAGGVGVGDRVGILLPQRPETAVAHIATYRLGAIAVPLFVLFGPDALRFRLADSGAVALITDAEGAARLDGLHDTLPALRTVLTIEALPALLARAAPQRAHLPRAPDDPALIIYTSGTTGSPKGALHAHRVLRGHLPGVAMPHHGFPQPGDLIWTPADWAWIGGLLDVLLPGLFHGVAVFSHRFQKFDPDAAYDLMARQGVRNVFMPPTALRMLAQTRPRVEPGLRTLASGGETLGAALLDFGQAVFGLPINEFYGQTECNLVVGNGAPLFPIRPGSMGRAVPGHRVGVIDGDGRGLPPGTAGDIAVLAPDPVMFLGYWNNSAATEAKFRGPWLVTGDTGRIDSDGHLHFAGRDDDVITSAGYRIGPGPIEDCLCRHQAVSMAAVVGVPDEVRTEIVKAFVVLKPGFVASDALAAELAGFVREKLAAHEYPRAISFVDALPTTATGKVMRRVLRGEP
jgi:acetyl-CoA synthetase